MLLLIEINFLFRNISTCENKECNVLIANGSSTSAGLTFSVLSGWYKHTSRDRQMRFKSIQFLFSAVTKESNGSAAAHMGKNFLIKRAFGINQNTWSLEKVKRTMCHRIGNLWWSTEQSCCIVVVVVVVAARCHRANSGKFLLLL